MFAVIKTGGKQYRVAQNDIVAVERLEGEAGDTVSFDSVLMMANGDDIKVGAGAIEGALVKGEILEQKRGDKVLILKKKRRKHYRRRAGHRQYQTVVKITEILGAAAASKAS